MNTKIRYHEIGILAVKLKLHNKFLWNKNRKIIGSWSILQSNGKVQYTILNLGCMNGRNDMAYRLLNIEFKVIACVDINYIHSNNDNVDNEKYLFFIQQFVRWPFFIIFLYIRLINMIIISQWKKTKIEC